MGCEAFPRIVGVMFVLLALLLGCSRSTKPAPALAVSVAAVVTNSDGEIVVHLSITNELSRGTVVAVRSTIHQADGAWVTNHSAPPRFVGFAGLGSTASEVTLDAGEGITSALSALKLEHPFRIELVCFPKRTGIVGAVDGAKDKLDQFKDGSPHHSYLGDSFFVSSPLITPQVEPFDR